MMKLTVALILSLVLAALIAFTTLSPPSGGPALPLNDKQLHALAFALLVLPLAWVRPHWWPGLAITAILFGGGIEILQPMVSRSAEWGDLLADAVGVALGLIPGQLRRKFI